MFRVISLIRLTFLDIASVPPRAVYVYTMRVIGWSILSDSIFIFLFLFFVNSDIIKLIEKHNEECLVKTKQIIT